MSDPRSRRMAQDEVLAGDRPGGDHLGADGLAHEGDDPVWEPFRPARGRRRRSRWRRLIIGLAVLLTVVVVTGALAYGWVERRVNPGGPLGPAVAVTVPTGSSTGAIAALLARRGVIRDGTVFRWYLRLTGAGTFHAGDYTFRSHEHYAAAVATLRRGPQVSFDRITIPEGWTLAQIAERVGRLPGRSADRFLAAATSGDIRSRFQPPGSTNLEGLLFPSTYSLDRHDDEAAILRKMVQAFDDTATSLGIDQAASSLGLTPYQLVTVASMVEREAKLDADRGPIASVIYNRLHRNMTLGIDATLLYGLHTASLTRHDLASDNPYNTRKRAGLPPTPIASPGIPSLRAALNPPATAYLYYVLADPSGRHAFATSAAEFARLQAACRAQALC